jgi:hypothetical protein
MMEWAGGGAIGALLGAFVVAIVAWWKGRKKANGHAVDLEGAKARAVAETRAAFVGRDAEIARIEREYEDAVDNLDAKQREQAEQLREDPGARAEFLARVLAGGRARGKAGVPGRGSS